VLHLVPTLYKDGVYVTIGKNLRLEKSHAKYHLRKSGFGATVSKTVRPMLLDRCLSCLSVLSVTLVYCGQTVGWIKNMAQSTVVIDLFKFKFKFYILCILSLEKFNLTTYRAEC